MTGRVISFNRHRHYGFIQNDDGDHFFHDRNAYKGIKEGDNVSFSLVGSHVKGVRKIETDG